MMVGTTNYVAPEMIKYHEKCDDFPLAYSLDLWAAACIMYQMIDGTPPFVANSEFHTLRRILEAEESLTFSDTFDPLAKDLCSKILRKDTEKRLGHANLDDVRNHDFFPKWEWAKLPKMKVPRPENLKDPKDVPKLLPLSSPRQGNDNGDSKGNKMTKAPTGESKASESTQRASRASRQDPDERFLRHKTLSLRKMDIIDADEKVLRCEQCVMRRIPCLPMKYLIVTSKNRLLVLCPFFHKLLHDFNTFWVEKWTGSSYVVLRGGLEGRRLYVKDGDGSWARFTRFSMRRKSVKPTKSKKKDRKRPAEREEPTVEDVELV